MRYFFVFLTAFLQPHCHPSFETIFCVVTYMTLDGLDYVQQNVIKDILHGRGRVTKEKKICQP